MKPIFYLLFCVCLTSCFPTKLITKSPEEVSAMTTHYYNEPNDIVFKSIISLLQSNSYFIDKADKELNLITATRILSNKNRGMGVDLYGYSEDAKISKVMFYLDDIKSDSIEMKITLYEGWEQTVKKGEDSYLKDTDMKMVYNPKAYQDLFQKVSNEIEKRKNR